MLVVAGVLFLGLYTATSSSASSDHVSPYLLPVPKPLPRVLLVGDHGVARRQGLRSSSSRLLRSGSGLGTELLPGHLHCPPRGTGRTTVMCPDRAAPRCPGLRRTGPYIELAQQAWAASSTVSAPNRSHAVLVWTGNGTSSCVRLRLAMQPAISSGVRSVIFLGCRARPRQTRR